MAARPLFNSQVWEMLGVHWEVRMDGEEEQEYGLLLAFDTDDPEFTRGFEIGQMWERLERDGFLQQPLAHASNSEMFMRMAEAKGMRFSAEEVNDEWVSITIAPDLGPVGLDDLTGA